MADAMRSAKQASRYSNYGFELLVLGIIVLVLIILYYVAFLSNVLVLDSAYSLGPDSAFHLDRIRARNSPG